LLFFDLLPEAIYLAEGRYDVHFVTSVVALGFMAYLILDRLIVLHSHADGDAAHSGYGRLGAVSLATHGFLDGVAVGRRERFVA